jgi:transcription elongation factor GreA
MQNEQQLTREGKQRLEAELAHIREVRQPEMTRRIQESNEEGDISDNSEYEDLKEEMVRLEARVQELEYLLSRAEIVEATSTDTAGFGSTVTIRDNEGFVETWTLVSSQEQDSRSGAISIESPVGHALMGKKIGESVEVSTPAGAIVYTVVKVQ